MIDFHSHILPGIDDGAKNSIESIMMLVHEKKNAVSAVVATPHFYASRTTPEIFLHKRKKATQSLLKYYSHEQNPTLYLGAEVAYFPGIGNSKAVSDLCIYGTDLILVEMPAVVWTESVFNDLYGLINNGYRPIIAHIERCLFFQSNQIQERLFDSGVLIQSNASFISEQKHGQISNLFKKYRVDLLGTDAHDMNRRKPNMAEAVSAIERYVGEEVVEKINVKAESLLKNAVPFDQIDLNGGER